MLKKDKKDHQKDELAVIDAGIKTSNLQAAGPERYELRLAVNFTARRNFLPVHERGRKPKYGEIVRPLPLKYKDKTLAASVPDETYTWKENQRELRAEIWRRKCFPNKSCLLVSFRLPAPTNSPIRERVGKRY